jgi:hypothetical protein
MTEELPDFDSMRAIAHGPGLKASNIVPALAFGALPLQAPALKIVSGGRGKRRGL